VRDVPPEYLFSLAINGMLMELDPHSVMLEKKDLENFNIHTNGEFGGIGIQIGLVDKVLTVIAPIEGTPAYNLGIMPGDKIVKIEGESTKGYTLNKAVSVLRGKPGTDVNITIFRDGKEIDYKNFSDTFLLATNKINKESIIYISADKTLTYGDVMYILKSVKESGFTKVSLVTDG